MYRVRQWSVNNSRKLEALYRSFESTLVRLHPLLNRLGYQRLEKPVRVVERAVKKSMFDCQMCGKCVLSSTGMSCPMNCPKTLRNGPCGGVRLNGNCEVKPEMRCVWVDAWQGSQQHARRQGDPRGPDSGESPDQGHLVLAARGARQGRRETGAAQ